MTPEELNERWGRMIGIFDSLKIAGPGWSGDSRTGFQFDLAAAGLGDAFGLGSLTGVPPGAEPPPGTTIPPGGGPPVGFQFGVCCTAGACEPSTAGQCGGQFFLNGDCFMNNPCGMVGRAGACCNFPNNCAIVPANQCSGTYFGDNSICEGIDCGLHWYGCPPGTAIFCACGPGPGQDIPPGPYCCGPGDACTGEPAYHCATCAVPGVPGSYCCCCCCMTAFGLACTFCGF